MAATAAGTMAATVHNGPPTREIACVAYGILLLLVLLIICWHSARRGLLCWHQLSWIHVTHSARGLGPAQLGLLRLAMAVFALSTTTAMGLWGLDAFATFTVWTWGLIGLYLATTGVASLVAASGIQCPGSGAGADRTSRAQRVLGCVLWVWFEVLFSNAILVCLMVWLVLLPAAYKHSGTDEGMLTFLQLSAHNCNVIFMAVEMALNRLVFVKAHVIFVFLFGMAYVYFSWFFFLFGDYHYFCYFFIDWRFAATPIWYTVLMVALAAGFAGGRCLTLVLKVRRAEALLPGGARKPEARDVPPPA